MIVAQSPPGCIVPVSGVVAAKPPLLDFDVLQEYIIPRAAFFNRYITVNDPENKYAVLGFPVSIPDQKYRLNEFIFNHGHENDKDQNPKERVVRRLAASFAEIEKLIEFLSQEGKMCGSGSGGGGGGGSSTVSGARGEVRRHIESLLEIIK